LCFFPVVVTSFEIRITIAQNYDKQSILTGKGFETSVQSLQISHVNSTVSTIANRCRHQSVDIKESTVDHFDISVPLTTYAVPTEAHTARDFSINHRWMSAIQP
jgi:hypothetical protein